MKKNFVTNLIFCFLLSSLSAQKNGTNEATAKPTIWIISHFLNTKTDSTIILGSPAIVKTKYGNAVRFNGKNDAIFTNKMPLRGLKAFTIEMIFKPASDGNFEQRMFHCGEITGSRVLLELRSTPKGWYFDGFIKSGSQKKTLVDSTLLHKPNQWYHVALVVNCGLVSTYINGRKELEQKIDTTPLLCGKTSIGVRQTKKSWFKGLIYKIKISPKALLPQQFMIH